LDEGHNHKTPQRILAADCGNVVQTPERNPVMNPQKDDLKRLQSEQSLLQRVARRGHVLCRILCLVVPIISHFAQDDTSALAG
jgi:hypothetical protein